MVHEGTICQECARSYVYVVGYESAELCPGCLHSAFAYTENLEVELSQARFEADEARLEADEATVKAEELELDVCDMRSELERLRDLREAVRALRAGDGEATFPGWRGWSLIED